MLEIGKIQPSTEKHIVNNIIYIFNIKRPIITINDLKVFIDIEIDTINGDGVVSFYKGEHFDFAFSYGIAALFRDMKNKDSRIIWLLKNHFSLSQ